MSDLDLLRDAKAAAFRVYKRAVDRYHCHDVKYTSATEWDGEFLARDHILELERATAAFPESIALQARREAIDQFIEAHFGAEWSDTTHEDEMRRLRP